MPVYPSPVSDWLLQQSSPPCLFRSCLKEHASIKRELYCFDCPSACLRTKNPRAVLARGLPFSKSAQRPTYHFSTVVRYRYSSVGRSSGLRVILLTAPSRLSEKVSGVMRLSSPITAAGPLLICTGFPIIP